MTSKVLGKLLDSQRQSTKKYVSLTILRLQSTGSTNMDSLVWLLLRLLTGEFLENDLDEILFRALCVDITGRIISARNLYSK